MPDKRDTRVREPGKEEKRGYTPPRQPKQPAPTQPAPTQPKKPKK